MYDFTENSRGHDLLHLVEEGLQPVLLEREKRLARLPLRLKNTVNVGDLQSTPTQEQSDSASARKPPAPVRRGAARRGTPTFFASGFSESTW